MKKNRYLIIGLALIAAGMLGLITMSLSFMGSLNRGMGRGMMGGMMWGQGMMGGMMRGMDDKSQKTEFSSNGERIYFTGINARGKVIKNSHGIEGLGCAMCHGADAEGMRMMMMDVPPLRWKTLTALGDHIHTNGRKHPAFTEATFKTCVLAGVDSAGNRLSTMMPRWQMSNEDLNDLIDYLKTR